MLADTDTNHQWTALTGRNNSLWLSVAQHCDGIGAFEYSHRGLSRGQKVALLAEVVMNQMGDNLGIGLRGEFIAQPF